MGSIVDFSVCSELWVMVSCVVVVWSLVSMCRWVVWSLFCVWLVCLRVFCIVF